jgi:hypothetical protein
MSCINNKSVRMKDIAFERFGRSYTERYKVDIFYSDQCSQVDN